MEQEWKRGMFSSNIWRYPNTLNAIICISLIPYILHWQFFSQFFRVIEKSTGINNRIILKGSPVCCLLASGCQCVATAVSTWTTAWLFQRPRVWGHMWMHTYRHILIYISRPKHRCFAFYICSSSFKGNKIDTQISRWICQRVLWGNTSVARNWCLAYFSSLFGERMHLWNPQSHLKCQM